MRLPPTYALTFSSSLPATLLLFPAIRKSSRSYPEPGTFVAASWELPNPLTTASRGPGSPVCTARSCSPPRSPSAALPGRATPASFYSHLGGTGFSGPSRIPTPLLLLAAYRPT